MPIGHIPVKHYLGRYMPEAIWSANAGRMMLRRMNRIAQIRHDRGMSQQKLGEALGLDQSAVSKIENERVTVSLDNLRDIARALETTVCALLEPPPFSPEVMAVAARLEAMSEGTRDTSIRVIDTLDTLQPGDLVRLRGIVSALKDASTPQ